MKSKKLSVLLSYSDLRFCVLKHVMVCLSHHPNTIIACARSSLPVSRFGLDLGLMYSEISTCLGFAIVSNPHSTVSLGCKPKSMRTSVDIWSRLLLTLNAPAGSILSANFSSLFYTSCQVICFIINSSQNDILQVVNSCKSPTQKG